MTKTATVVILAVLMLLSAVEPVRAQTQQPVTTASVRAETRLSKVVVFITVEPKPPTQPSNPSNSLPTASPANPETRYGTGFLVAVPDSRLGNGKGFPYLGRL
jgi:hypothetical protein